jgi:tetratricopeptide (TPR) repeat protein
MLLAEMGKMSEAEKAFRAAFKANSQSARAAYNLGVLLSKDHPEEALDWCRRATELGRDNPQYGYTYAFYLRQAGRLDQALQVVRSVRERHPAHEDSAMLEQSLLREQKASEKKQPFKN